jgi:hypothetical protein
MLINITALRKRIREEKLKEQYGKDSKTAEMNRSKAAEMN